MHPFNIRLVYDDGRTVEIHGPADITQEKTEAIVNAANSYLMGGGGVDGAIHRAGGSAIIEECAQIVASKGRLATGQAVITGGGRLAAKYVIHTVGPVYRRGESSAAELLASCHQESLRLAHEHGIRSIAFPAISTGAYGYPVTKAAPVAIKSVVSTMATTTGIRTARFVLFDLNTRNAYLRSLQSFAESAAARYRIERGNA